MATAFAAVPSSDRRDALVSRIIEAALELFAERGYHGTSVPSVMERAGVGGGSLYRLFEGKEALVNAVFRDAKGRLEQALRAELPADAAPWQLFDAFWSRLASFARTEPLRFRFLELQDHAPYLDGESRQLELTVLAPILLACMDLQRRGVFRADVEAPTMIAFVWGAFVGLVKAERLGYLKLTDERLDAARDACWRAFAVDAPRPDDVPTGTTGRRTPWKRSTR
ncbi:MAG TPA: TetR/AcrR family transcriptional regulator [Polyangiaceae bacterium]|jgi:AcrR family transcriptional regulator